MIPIGPRRDVLISSRTLSVVEHLRDFHREVQALSCLKADVRHWAVAEETANPQAAAEVAVVGDVQERLQGGGPAATQIAQRPDTLAAPSHGGQQTVQWVAEETCQEDCSTEVSHKTESEKEKKS